MLKVLAGNCFQSDTVERGRTAFHIRKYLSAAFRVRVSRTQYSLYLCLSCDFARESTQTLESFPGPSFLFLIQNYFRFTFQVVPG